MNVLKDAAVLGPSVSHPVNNSDVFLIAQRLNAEASAVLYELDEYEDISLVFLLLDVDSLARNGFKYCHFIRNGKAKDAMDNVVTAVRRSKGHLVSVIEALHIIGRYDLLEDRLGLTVDQNFRTVFGGNVDVDRKALYCVFAGMPQGEADRILQSRLTDWFCDETGRPLEETFARNLSAENYKQRITELFTALMEEDKKVLALYIRPFAQLTPPPPQPPPSLTPQISQNCDSVYPLPVGYPHGLCIIINVKSFMKPRGAHDNIPLSERHGSDIDKYRLTGTFKLFGFHVMHLDNPDYDQLHHFFKGLRISPKLAIVACLAVCVMTHGDENDQIYLHDRSCISVTDLRKLCFGQALINKPRLYFVQACRGERALQPIFLQLDDCSVTHMESDCLISAATVKGHSAIRSQTKGSWYITDLCQALQELGHIYPMKTVLHKTRQVLKARVDSMDNTYVTQLSEEKDTLVKDVQLMRADEEHFLEGILDLAELEIIEKFVDDQFDEILNVAERMGTLSDIMNRFANISVA